MLIDELFFKLGIKADIAPLKAFANTLQSVENSAVADTFDEASASAKKAANEVNKVNKEVRQTSQAADSAGKSFKEAGEKISKFKGYLTLVATAAAGLAAGIAKSVQAVTKEIEQYAQSKNRLFDVSKEEITQAKQYSQSMERVGGFLESLKVRVSLGLLPALERLLSAFEGLLVSNKELVADGLTTVIKWIVTGVEMLLRFGKAVDNVISNTIGRKVAIGILTTAVLILNRALLANPITWVILAIVGLIAIIDDLITYLNGGESQFAAFWEPAIKWAKKAWDYVKPIIDEWKKRFDLVASGIKIIFGGLWNYVKSLFEIWGDDSTSRTEKIKKTFDTAITWIKTLFTGLGTVIPGMFGLTTEDAKKFVEDIKQKFSKVTDAIKAPFKAAFDWVKETYDKTIGSVISGVRGFGEWLGIVDKADAPVPSSAATSSSHTINNRAGDVNAHVTVVSPDAARAAENMSQGLAPAIRQANYNLSGGMSF